MQTDTYVVHIVDDEEPVRRSLGFLLSVMGFNVRVHDSATSFLAAAPSAGNACLVTDLGMPDMNGVELLERLNEMGAMMPSIVVTGRGDVPMAVAAMRAGAIDFIEKPFEDDVLVDAIKRAASSFDGTAKDGDDTSALLSRLEQLSEREREVLSGLVGGLSNKTIAYDLDINPRTVEIHRANVMSKMQAKSLPELIRMAIAMDLPDERG
ncbi:MULTISPECIES: response regulator FixJ [unclassified Mesorhizobium]|uniref:response regulator FixJ n=1 Tax=unclassified Mesorhizobium TaxID=325217 RepID=UPI000FE3CC6E|nr:MULTISPECIES: response regulator FixJ [unclassified Mesorhizobium]MDG4897585.1 response regulator FixJ [Mesorhizobium sp. WSM4976]RWH72862.1 MAG: response regulator [Mesorhizobium sp.]RWL34252.1 MAG: response regulator [Mesorhizobium sp.]RWL35668.1 MAG: response regulator [Mesorhizobium sp.]RWL41078.1 MAG: response regulator [Mesorhizobium sp.]